MADLRLLLDFFSFSKYGLVFLGSVVEGPVVMIGSGFLLRAGQFEFWPLYAALMAGDLAADIGWYAVGRFGARKAVNRFGHLLNLTPEIIGKVELRFKKYQNRILFISKITMGFGLALATLLVAGMLHVPFRRYLALNFLGGFVWTALLMAIGFFFANVYFSLAGQLKPFFIAAMAAAVIWGLWALNRYLIKTEI